MATIKVLTLTCKKCDHEWTPRQADVRICPRCKTAKWDVERPDRNAVGGPPVTSDRALVQG